jgi:hypothetical protein
MEISTRWRGSPEWPAEVAALWTKSHLNAAADTGSGEGMTWIVSSSMDGGSGRLALVPRIGVAPFVTARLRQRASASIDDLVIRRLRSRHQYLWQPTWSAGLIEI